VKGLSLWGAVIGACISVVIDVAAWRIGMDPANYDKGYFLPLAFAGLVAAILATSIISSVERLPSGRNLSLGIGIGFCAIYVSTFVDAFTSISDDRNVDMGTGLAMAFFGMPTFFVGFLFILFTFVYAYYDNEPPEQGSKSE
jgi:chromate transport protein ChrA